MPFARSWALPVWSATVGVYWLHGMAIQEQGTWVETPWVTALAHLPVITVMLWEMFGPVKEPQEPGKVTLFQRPAKDLPLAT